MEETNSRAVLPAWSNEPVDDERDDRFAMAGYRADTYGEAFADVYDDWYADLGDDDFVSMMCASVPDTPVRVLELGVGTGRLVEAWRRMRRGVPDDIVGVDSSVSMLEIARARLGATATLVEGDFSGTLPPGPFDVVFAGYNTLFNLPDDEAVSGCLEQVAAVLAPGGMLCLDLVTPPSAQGGDNVSVKSMTATDVVLSISRHDASAQRIEGQFVQFRHGAQVHLRPWSVRYLSPAQLDELAGSAGLSLSRRMGDGHGAPFDPDGPRHISCYVPFTHS